MSERGIQYFTSSVWYDGLLEMSSDSLMAMDFLAAIALRTQNSQNFGLDMLRFLSRSNKYQVLTLLRLKEETEINAASASK